MTTRVYKTHDDLVTELNKDPGFRREYRRLKPYYDLVHEIIIRRKELKITQEELARRAGTYQSRISKIESAEYDIRLSTLVAIAEALEAEAEIKLVPIFQLDQFDYQELVTVVAGKSSPPKYTPGPAAKAYTADTVPASQL